MIKILAKEWRSATDTIGIILIENEVGEQSARIGAIRKIEIPGFGFHSTNTEAEDAMHIAETGAKLLYSEAKAFFPWIKRSKYKQK